jgi:hypothetical protein
VFHVLSCDSSTSCLTSHRVPRVAGCDQELLADPSYRHCQ